MASITVNEAAGLVGRSRRTLYRDMKRGNLSFTTRRDGHRQIETSELERCYGALKMPEPVTLSRVTETPETERLLAELIEITKRQASEIAKLREEIREVGRLPPPKAEGREHSGDEDDPNGFRALVKALKDKEGIS